MKIRKPTKSDIEDAIQVLRISGLYSIRKYSELIWDAVFWLSIGSIFGCIFGLLIGLLLK